MGGWVDDFLPKTDVVSANAPVVQQLVPDPLINIEVKHHYM